MKSKTRAGSWRASERKSQFLASMSHEAAHPLTPSIGLTEMMSSTRRASAREKALEPLRACECRRDPPSSASSRVLDLSKIEAG